MKVRVELEESDYGRLHDILLEITNDKFTQEELVIVWNGLPQSLKDEAIHWGMSDTVVRDNIYEHLKDKWDTTSI